MSAPSDAMDIDSPTIAVELTNGTLLTATAAREEERALRRRNGNISTKVRAKTGAPPNELNAKLVIRSLELSSHGKETTYYYCIGCDRKVASNATCRLLPHAKECRDLARDFSDTYNEVLDALGLRSTESVLSGEGTAPGVRSNKRKAADPELNRVPLQSDQGKITQSFGPSRLTAEQQARIDFYLLRFLICCSIAFSILDNGFFIDLVTAL